MNYNFPESLLYVFYFHRQGYIHENNSTFLSVYLVFDMVFIHNHSWWLQAVQRIIDRDGLSPGESAAENRIADEQSREDSQE